ncbi:hypothetical protein GLOTRDRAFT_89713 [Gloeophyllum trabeum ATCC 11539]|uniref:Uncharacterized protein n=1 Tax=Gloeophyllum trabeum (strain ATCC 11539 / FP-39264 / Madison 617) TaxID=670483 RepID=S7QLB2_GLOTA|nr:uncharacterized protein GLOTRDRAFT_89713 [Gloeophyllum trabeum ATCC 11539]EPQ60102.1 hypothetical protein GLOTRDRAFT_89713 [Gloeophyllum trabeum ATCC 11539]
MRRAQSVRHYARPSLALGADDLGMLKESPDESNEDVLRRQLLEKDRELDKIQSLQAQLQARPPLEAVQELQKEYKNLDLLLQGTQRENERCMAELERGKNREKMLEKELEKLAGVNWQHTLNIPSSNAHTRPGSTSNAPVSTQPEKTAPSPAAVNETMAHIEQVRLLILGMEQRLQVREEKLAKSIDKAQSEGRRFEEMRKQLAAPQAS